ncbi:unnamed protein product [Rhizophagus irregularis]|nr:unnamed protein product [Rhizophagus irregularis]CAB5203184.1 unnamed protein product [Rhizophagus irregularis]
MEPQDRIFTHFPIQPQRIYSGEKGINVIVYPPTETVPEPVDIAGLRMLKKYFFISHRYCNIVDTPASTSTSTTTGNETVTHTANCIKNTQDR